VVEYYQILFGNIVYLLSSLSRPPLDLT